MSLDRFYQFERERCDRKRFEADEEFNADVIEAQQKRDGAWFEIDRMAAARDKHMRDLCYMARLLIKLDRRSVLDNVLSPQVSWRELISLPPAIYDLAYRCGHLARHYEAEQLAALAGIDFVLPDEMVEVPVEIADYVAHLEANT